jgi:flagellin
MALTVTNTNTLSLLNILNRTTLAQSNSLTRLSTGFRINRGADDPAGLIASRSLESELTSTDVAIRNNQRTDSLLGVADSALGEVAKLIGEIQSLAQASANPGALSPAELAANQAQIDDAIAAIDRIIGTTTFNGKKLLDGSQAINVSGVNTSNITDVQVFNRNPNQGNQSLSVNVTTAATKGTAAVASANAGSALSLSIQGKTGNVVIDIASGETVAQVASKIDAATAQTGVDAVVSGSTLYLVSSDYGSKAFVRATVISGNSAGTYVNANDDGSDAAVTVNGQTAAVDGLNVSFGSNGVNVSFNLTAAYNTAGGSTSFTITNTGGLTFQLGTDASTQANVGISGLYSQQLGSANDGYLTSLKSGGANSLLANPTQAAKIAAAANSLVAKAQGRVGGFQKFQVKTALAQMNATKESLTSALSTIKDVDYASETAELNRQNVLLQSAIGLLGLANQQSAQVLSLLR